MSNIKEQQEKSKKKKYHTPGKMLTPGGEQEFAPSIYTKCYNMCLK